MTEAAGIKPDIRVSDAERDATVAQLGTHFQDGRLDRAELDQRIEAAITAKTRGDLDVLLTDLPAPRAAPTGESPARRRRAQPPWLPLVPVLALVIVIGTVATGWHQHGPGAPFGFLWLIVPALVVRFWIVRGLGSRRRQWR
jgi:hypothetical protein